MVDNGIWWMVGSMLLGQKRGWLTDSVAGLLA